MLVCPRYLFRCKLVEAPINACVVMSNASQSVVVEPPSKKPKPDDGRPQTKVPSTQRRQRSTIWMSFTTGTVEGRSVATCNLCEKVLRYNGATTSNLLDHLAVHRKRTDEACRRQHRMDQFVTTKPPTRSCSDLRARDITFLLARYCWINLRPINLVHDQGLRDLLAFIEPGYSPPSHTHIASIVRNRHSDAQQLLRRILAEQSSIALTTDIWTSGATQAYATTTAHFVDTNGSWSMKSCCLETVHFGGHHTGERIAEKLKAVAAGYGINRKVTAVVHDQAANAELAGEFTLMS